VKLFFFQLRIADLVAESHRQMERLQAQSDTSSRASRSLELRVQSLEQDLQLARLELSNTVSEYEGYKVLRCNLVITLILRAKRNERYNETIVILKYTF